MFLMALINLDGKINGELILGTAMGYNFEELKPFIFSLKNSGYKGDLCLFISKIDRKTYQKLKEYGIKMIPFQEEHPFTHKLTIPNELIPDNVSSGKISVKYLRYLLYYMFLLKYGNPKSKILLTDVRDVIFQRNPFDFNFNNLCSFIEDTHITIKASPFNSLRIQRHFGSVTLEKIGNNYPLCSGITFGHFSSIMDYLKKMIYLFPTVDTVGGGDQGLHNYLIYSGEIKNLKLFDHENGPVFTFGTKIINSIHINKEGFIIKSNGDVYNIIHQYDRHPELFDKLSIPYKIHMPLKLPFIFMKNFLSWKNRIESMMGGDIINKIVMKFFKKLGLSSTIDRWHLL